MISVNRKSGIRKPSAPRGRPVATRHCCSPDEVSRALARERDRAERTGLPLSMVVFSAVEPEDRPHVLRALEAVLASRLRLSDEFGHLDDRHMAALLPATDPEGAWTVADDVCLRLPADLTLPDCEVFIYPEDAANRRNTLNSGTHADRRTPADVEHGEGITAPASEDRQTRLAMAETQFARPSAHAVAALAPANNGLEEAAMRRSARIDRATCSRAGVVRPMSALFTRPLPAWKRLLDILVAAGALAVLSPLFVIVAATIKLTSPGPVFYGQWRSGLAGRRFKMYKFRSMVVDADRLKDELREFNEQDGPAFKIRRDPRVTSVGRVIRRLSIDELPQFYNVLVGDMSLVGPRPLPCEESEQCAGWHRRRLEVTPGLTCIWQISGRSSVTWDDWVRMDLSYANSRSPWHDFKLLLKTIPAVLSGRGAS